MASAGEELITFWKYLYSKNARATVVGTIFAMLLGGGGAWYASYQGQLRQAELERKRTESLSYNQQLHALNDVQGSLNSLIQFVELEKAKLKQSEDLINTLKSEQEKLRPVVEADRRTVDAILELQSQKQKQGVWYERGFGFILGVLSSILASTLVAVTRYFIKRRRPSPATT